MPDPEKKSFQDSVKGYERLVFTGDAKLGVKATVAFLDELTRACSQGGFVEKHASTAVIEHWYTRAAAALSHFLTAPDRQITLSELEEISKRKQSVAYIMSASGFRNMAHLIDLIGQVEPDGRITVKTHRAAVLLSFINLDDVPDLLMTTALKQPPAILLHLMLGWLNQRAVLTPQGERNRSRLLTSGHLIENVEVTDALIPPIINAWMYASYASEPRKHEIKKYLNGLISNLLRRAKITAVPVSHRLKKVPKILVIHERFVEPHAMYRCYAYQIRTLGRFFKTVAMSDANMIDSASDDLFDEVIAIPKPRPPVGELVKLIQEQKPDVIYFPSLGMSHWTVMVAGLRLAPIQVMTFGHPATSMLPTMDYAYLPNIEGDAALIHSERVILGPVSANFDPHPGLPEDLPPLLPPSDREVRIAVNSKVMKLSWRLLEICKRIEKEASVPVSFSFFPGEQLLYMDGLDAAIRAQLPAATVVPYCNYDTFLKELCKCDMALAAFPFGNTNSTVDTCLLGLPTVAFFGPEVPAQSDKQVLKSAGLADWLVCDNDEDYFRTALSLVNDPSRRVQAMSGQNRESARKKLISNAERSDTEPFGEVIFKLYRNHGALVNSPQRVLDYRQVLEMKG